MKAVAYCEVANDQEKEMDNQHQFFMEYAERNGYNLTKIYADENRNQNGMTLKDRTQFLGLLSDAQSHQFDAVLIRNVPRMVRNTTDFLTGIRKIKALGIQVVFVTCDQTSLDSSEFTLTLLSAILREERVDMSNR